MCLHLRFIELLPPANVVCEGYVFTRVCLSTGGGGIPACLAGGIPACLAGLPGGVSQHALQVSKPTPKGQLEGSPGGSPGLHLVGSSGPHLGGFSRPKPGGVLQAHTQGSLQAHTWGVYPSMH